MRKKLAVYSLQLTVLLFLLLTVNYQLSTIHAASPSPMPAPTVDPALLEFQQQVNDIKAAAATKAAQLQNQVAKTIQNKAFVGTVSATLNQQLTIQSLKGPHTINVDQYTVYQDTTQKKPITFTNIKVGDYISALGDVDDKQNLQAKKIVKSKPTNPGQYVVWGQIQSILLNNFTMLRTDNQKITVDTDSETVFRLGSNDATMQNLKINNFVISVGSNLANNTSNAQFIYLLNPKGDLKIASASATPTASPKKK